MSRTSALTRKPKGLGRRNFAQGYSHATPTPTSKSKDQKSRSPGGGILWRPPSRTACLFYGRLILWLWLTEVRESFTRGGPWVSLEKLLLGFFLVILKLQGGPKSDEICRIFRPHPQTFRSHARTRQNIVILKKKLVKHRWMLYKQCHVWWTLAYKPLTSTRHIIVLKK